MATERIVLTTDSAKTSVLAQDKTHAFLIILAILLNVTIAQAAPVSVEVHIATVAHIF